VAAPMLLRVTKALLKLLVCWFVVNVLFWLYVTCGRQMYQLFCTSMVLYPNVIYFQTV